jgi:hypothetical protein
LGKFKLARDETRTLGGAILKRRKRYITGRSRKEIKFFRGGKTKKKKGEKCYMNFQVFENYH